MTEAQGSAAVLEEVNEDFLQSLRSSNEIEPLFQAASLKSKEVVPVNSIEDLMSSSEEGRFLCALAALVWNIAPNDDGRLDKGKIHEVIARIDDLVEEQINEIIHHKDFQELESTWRGLFDLVVNTNFRKGVTIGLLDVTKQELKDDFEDHAVDFTGAAFFKKVYINEFDQYGGHPYGSVIGLYELEHTPSDEMWLRTMGKIATVSHAPFITSVAPSFFGCETAEELEVIKNLEGLMNQPKYSSFNKLRDSEEAAYIGLCLPRYVLRLPWHPVTNPCGGNFMEHTWGDNNADYLWGNAAILFAKNLVSSFEESGWCQHIRGPKGGGLVKGLPVHTFNIRGEEEYKIPVEFVIPDHRELEFSNCGFIPLIYRKNSGDACFFGAQSLKRPKVFTDPKDSENAQFATKLPYTFSISRVAHYVKSIMRDNIGSTGDEQYIQNYLTDWLMDYVTTATNPDDRTLRRFPFKAASIQVEPQPGVVGYYKAIISVLPHIQIEGFDAELRIESRLGTK